MVIGGNPLQRLFKLGIINAQADFPGVLQLHLVHDQAFEHLLLQHFARWQIGALALQLLQRQPQSRAQFVQGDHFVIDHGDDPVGRQGLVGRA